MDKIQQRMHDAIVNPLSRVEKAEKCAAITQEVAVSFGYWLDSITTEITIDLDKQGIVTIPDYYTHYINTIYNGE